MVRKYFGTDGIRGMANKFPITAEMSLKVAMATAVEMKRVLKDPMHKSKVVIGKDTRISGYMIEQAMASGFLSMGMDVVLVGPVPTPAVAMLTRSLRADIGVMISASHNPYYDNGIKIFGYNGYKLDDEIEMAIEERIDSDLSNLLPEPSMLGKAIRLDDAMGRYVEYVKASFPRKKSLDGLRVVIDCAHGAAYKAAPQVLWELGADVFSIGVSPDGININDGYGATATENLQREVIKARADIGIALDGDADRLIIVDEKGNRIDGDQIIAALAVAMKDRNELNENSVVTTVMSNLGMERYLKKQNINMIRTAVGDRYVVDRMRQDGFNLGGEQSGHVVMLDYGTTGDGLLAALRVLLIISESGKKASECLDVFTPVPQILNNIRYASGNPLGEKDVKEVIASVEKKLADQGRILVRASGTEPLIRVMVEGDDQALVDEVVDEVSAVIKRVSK